MSWGAIGGAAVGVVGGAIMNKGGSGGDQTTTTTAPPDYLRPYLTAEREQSRQLREGVTPSYTQAAPILSYDQWLQQNPDVLSYADPSGMFDAMDAGNTITRTPQELQQMYAEYQASPDFQPRLNNPESDFETVVDQYGGLYPEAANQFGNAMNTGYIGMSPNMQATTDTQTDYAGAIATGAANIAGAGYNNSMYLQNKHKGPQFENVKDIKGVDGVAGQFGALAAQFGGGAAEGFGSEAGTTNLQSAYKSLGATDPTAALRKILGGQVDTEGLAGMQTAYVNRALQDYRDASADAGDMWQQQIAPQLRGDAILSGQYGGSRQGIAEGTAAGMIGKQLDRSARDLGIASIDTGQQLYGQAYQDALRRQAEAAGQQSGLAGQAAMTDTEAANRAAMAAAENKTRASIASAGNQAQLAGYQANLLGQDASNALAAQQFNANLGLARNQEDLQLYQQMINDMITGSNLGTTAISQADAGYGALQDRYDLYGREVQDQIGERDYGWDQLAQYNNILQGAQGSQVTQEVPGMSPIEAAGYGMHIGQGVTGYLNSGPTNTQVQSNVPSSNNTVYQSQPAGYTDSWGNWSGV